MTTSITIVTDDMELIAGIAALVAGGKAPKPAKPSPSPSPVAPATVVTQPVTAAAPVAQPVTAAAPVTTPPATTTTTIMAAAQVAPVTLQEDRLKNAIKLFLQSPGQDAGKCAVIMREFTDKKVVGKDGVERQSANRTDVPAGNVDACIAKLKTGMSAEFQAQV